MALTMILKSFLVDPMMLNVSAIISSSKLPTITGDDLRMAPASRHTSINTPNKAQAALSSKTRK